MAGASEFKALLLEKGEDGSLDLGFTTLTNDRLPEGDVTVAVRYTTLNYKDGMVMKGLGKLTRDFPHVPGIDFAGVVEESSSPDFKEGDEVVLTGWRVGEVHWGGYAERARVKSDWLVPVPKGLTMKQCMAIGTAGLTAMLAIMRLEENGLTPDQEGEVLVTGGSGGVGSVATCLLAKLGYRAAPSTGRMESHPFLKDLGAATIVGRAELETPPAGPLGKERWIGAIDNVGGPTLHTLLATLKYGATCAAVGLAATPELKTTVLPFLLRAVNLCGIDSTTCAKDRRLVAWSRLAETLPLDKLDAMSTEAPMADLPELGEQILKGGVRGRMVIEIG